MNIFILRKYLTTFAILLFLFSFFAIQQLKPGFLYNADGSLREFGVGFKRKTVIPIWLLSIILAILCYLTVLYAVTPSPKFAF
jgi:hypothetical protein